MHIVKALMSARVEVPDSVFERHSPFNPHTIGEQLAAQIDAYVGRESLGYYPALDYFQGLNLLDPQLLEMLDQLTWLETSLVRDELRLKLRPLFASMQVKSMQAVAYSMPQVRPSQPRALERLVRHLTPNQARFELLLTLFGRNVGNEKLESYITRASYRHLCDAFDTIEIGNIRILEQGR